MKNLNKDVGHVFDPTQIVIKSENSVEGSKTAEARVSEHFGELSTTIAMDYSDDRDDVSRPSSSSSGSHHSSVDILGYTISYCFVLIVLLYSSTTVAN